MHLQRIVFLLIYILRIYAIICNLHTKEDIGVKIQKCNKVQGASKINSSQRNSTEPELHLHTSKTMPRYIFEVCILNGKRAEI